jgi:hypothetical protein
VLALHTGPVFRKYGGRLAEGEQRIEGNYIVCTPDQKVLRDGNINTAVIFDDHKCAEVFILPFGWRVVPCGWTSWTAPSYLEDSQQGRAQYNFIFGQIQPHFDELPPGSPKVELRYRITPAEWADSPSSLR